MSRLSHFFISLSKHYTFDLSVAKVQGSMARLLFFLPFCHSGKEDHFVTARVDFGAAFSINLSLTKTSRLLLGIFRLVKSPSLNQIKH